MLSKISQRHHHFYVEFKKQNKRTNKPEQKKNHKYRKKTGGCLMGRGYRDG